MFRLGKFDVDDTVCAVEEDRKSQSLYSPENVLYPIWFQPSPSCASAKPYSLPSSVLRAPMPSHLAVGDYHGQGDSSWTPSGLPWSTSGIESYLESTLPRAFSYAAQTPAIPLVHASSAASKSPIAAQPVCSKPDLKQRLTPMIADSFMLDRPNGSHGTRDGTLNLDREVVKLIHFIAGRQPSRPIWIWSGVPSPCFIAPTCDLSTSSLCSLGVEYHFAPRGKEAQGRGHSRGEGRDQEEEGGRGTGEGGAEGASRRWRSSRTEAQDASADPQLRL